MIPEIVQPLLSVLSAHPYLFIFLGMIFAGEIVLLPAIYLAVTGRLNLFYVVGLSLAATLISDLFWYYLGRRFPASALRRLPGRRADRVVRGLEKLFRTKGAHVLFLSKFVYGTRVIAQVLCGIHDMRVRTYLVTNSLGVLAFMVMLVVMALLVTGSTRQLENVILGIEVTFLLFALVAVLVQFFVGRAVRQRWSQ